MNKINLTLILSLSLSFNPLYAQDKNNPKLNKKVVTTEDGKTSNDKEIKSCYCLCNHEDVFIYEIFDEYYPYSFCCCPNCQQCKTQEAYEERRKQKEEIDEVAYQRKIEKLTIPKQLAR